MTSSLIDDNSVINKQVTNGVAVGWHCFIAYREG